MNRAILEACLPLLAWLVGAFVALRLVIAVSGARWDFSRLRNLHRSERGGVQTLSFVFTLPLFIIIVLFIIQVSQLMIGVTVVNYAAFAAARSASVWIPARIQGAPTGTELVASPILFHDWRRENVLPMDEIAPEASNGPPSLGPEKPLQLDFETASMSLKTAKIFSAAVMACAPISPSRDLQGPVPTTPLGTAANVLYHALDPQASANQRIGRRVINKVAYSTTNTLVEIRYSSRPPSVPTNNPPETGPCGNPEWWPRVYSEVGWNDPIQITVGHNFALLPGPGRFLAKQIVSQDQDYVDRVSPKVSTASAANGETVYQTLLVASATLTNEGIKSIRPYEIRP